MPAPQHLTSAYPPQLEVQIRNTPSGMAHWSGSGPAGTACGGCVFYGYESPRHNVHGDTVGTIKKPQSCRRFYQLTGAHGEPLPPSTPSCRHFQAKPNSRASRR
jgi:hypothetical protein